MTAVTKCMDFLCLKQHTKFYGSLLLGKPGALMKLPRALHDGLDTRISSFPPQDALNLFAGRDEHSRVSRTTCSLAATMAYRSRTSHGIACPVTLRAASIISLTENPLPLPRLNLLEVFSFPRYSKALMCAEARSVT